MEDSVAAIQKEGGVQLTDERVMQLRDRLLSSQWSEAKQLVVDLDLPERSNKVVQN
jgi:hypothetical protein